MALKGVSNGEDFSKGINSPKVEQENENPPEVKSEISEQAELSQSNTAEEKNLDIIKEKIANKFYDSDEVLNVVADKILQDIRKPVK